MSGWKTILGGALIGASSILKWLDLSEVGDLLMTIGLATGIIGLGHKIEKNK